MGFVFFFLSAFIIVLPFLRKRIPALDRALARPGEKLGAMFSDDFKKALMLILTLAGVALYAYCLFCADKTSLEVDREHQNLFHVTAKLSMRVFPFFIFGCFLAGVIEKYFRAGRIPIPSSMLGNGIFGGLIPICSCAVIPLAQSMMHLHRIPVRAVITFLMVAPILNPMVIVLSLGTLGGGYLALRIIVTFAIAMLTGLIVERFAGVREEGKGPVLSCVGCSRSSAVKPEHAGSALMLGWNTMKNLTYYMLIGIALAAIFTVYVPSGLVGEYLSNNYYGLLLACVIGIPLYICSGEELLILSPLMDMGLPMGHAIAFTITGNAICITSIFIMLPAFGRKTTSIMVGMLFLGSLVAGFIINILAPYWPALAVWIK